MTDGWIRSKPNRTGAGLKSSLNPMVGSKKITGLDRKWRSETEEGCIETDDRIETAGWLRMNVTDGWLEEGSGIETEEGGRETEGCI